MVKLCLLLENIRRVPLVNMTAVVPVEGWNVHLMLSTLIGGKALVTLKLMTKVWFQKTIKLLAVIAVTRGGTKDISGRVHGEGEVREKGREGGREGG